MLFVFNYNIIVCFILSKLYTRYAQKPFISNDYLKQFFCGNVRHGKTNFLRFSSLRISTYKLRQASDDQHLTPATSR